MLSSRIEQSLTFASTELLPVSNRAIARCRWFIVTVGKGLPVKSDTASDLRLITAQMLNQRL